MLWWFGVGASVGVTERLWSGEGVAAAVACFSKDVRSLVGVGGINCNSVSTMDVSRFRAERKRGSPIS